MRLRMHRWMPIVVGLFCAIGPLGCSSVDGDLGLGDLSDVSTVEPDVIEPPETASCTSNADCDDDNPCTQGICGVQGVCETVVSEGAPCDDSDPCTEGESCQPKGECGGGSAVEVIAQACQSCTCDPTEGVVCTPMVVGQACSDNDCCTVDGTCQVCDPDEDPDCPDFALMCITQPVDCDDENPCTVDSCSCETENPECTNDFAPNGTPCDYSPNDCTTGDSCLGGQCVKSPEIDLDDENPCTEDLCEKGEVVHKPLLTGQCDDGDECTTDDTCLQGACVGGDLVECATGPCDSSASCVTGQGCVVVPKPVGASCEDDNLCSETSACDDEGQCNPVESVNCDDANPCTLDTCDPSVGCTSAPDEALEGAPCEQEGEPCSTFACTQGQCMVSGETSCDDDDPCTEDECDAEGECIHTPIEGCNGQDSCVRYGFEWVDAYGVLQSGTFDVIGQTITTLSFSYALYLEGSCEDLQSPWCHFPGDEWTIESSEFIELSPGAFRLKALSEHGTEFYFYKDDMTSPPAIYLYKPFGSQYTTADEEVSWSVIGACEQSVDPCDGVDCEADACATQACVEGVCVTESTTDCDDKDPCTEDSCDTVEGCQHTPIDGCGVTTGCASQVAEFDGQSCIEVSGTSAIDATTYTIEFWLQPLDSGSDQFLIDKLQAAPSLEDMGWSVRYNDMIGPLVNNVNYQEVNNGGGLTGFHSVETFPVGVWRHYALVRNPSGLMTRFVDGVSVGAGQNNYVVADQSTQAPMYIGCKDSDKNWFKGQIDELRISSGARYQDSFVPPAGPLTSDDDTLLLYHFDDAADGVVLDSGPLGLHGTWIGQDLRPHTGPVLSCDDLDPCTADQCLEDTCLHTPIEGCGEEPKTCGEETSVNCAQQGSGCCCFKESHILDLGQVIAPGQAIECCVRPGFNCGCEGEASISVSPTGSGFTEVSAFSTISDKVDGSCPAANQAVGWKDFCATITSEEAFQFIEGKVSNCFNDFFQCTIPAQDCDDDNPCTLDQCDPDTGACSHEWAGDNPACLSLDTGNNLVSFYALPDEATVESVFGQEASKVKWFFAEGVAGYRMSNGTLVGNYRALEPWRGYWVNMESDVDLYLDGTPRPVDLMYQLHEGINMVSFSGPNTMSVPDGIPDMYEPEFVQVIGASVIATKNDEGEWIGNAQLQPWRGYEVEVTQDIDDFMYDLQVFTPSDVLYGCTHPQATNLDPMAEIDDGNCLFDVPAGWKQPKWTEGTAMHQLIVMVDASSLGAEPLEGADAIGAFHEGASVGFGYQDGGFVTLSAMNVPYDGVVTFRRYDKSAGDEVVLDWTVSAPPMTEGYKTRFIIAGCTDPSATNYLVDATVETGGCQY